MKRHEIKFWFILSCVFLLLAFGCLFWEPIRFGSLFFGALFIGCAGEALVIKLQNKHKIFKITAIIGRIIFILFLISFISIQYIIISGEHTDDEVYNADRVLVLGSRIYDNRPSAALQSRLDTAIELLNENQDAVLIVCGGQGSNEIMPEAHMMKDYLLQNGVSEDKILVEDKSKNTIENIKNAKELYNLENYKTAVITNEFHLARARQLMKQAGLDAYGMPAPTPYILLKLVSHLREYCSTLGLILTNRYF